jgi:probable O-glycosylation ligase (exosortase A-associated)
MNPHRFTWAAAYDYPFAKIVAIVTIAGLLFTRDKMSLPKTRETILIVFLGIYFTFTNFFAFNPDAAWFQWQKVIKILVMTLITMVLINDWRKLKYLVMVIAFSIGFLGIKGGIFSFATGGEFRVYGPAGSFFSDNNDMALALNMTIPMLFYLAKIEENKRLKLVFWFAFIMSIVSIIFTYSRGGFLTLAAVGMLLLVKSRYKAFAVVIAAVIIFFSSTYIPEKWFERIDTIRTYEEDNSAMGRINAWHTAFNIAKDRPLIGGGFETFTWQVFHLYAPSPSNIHDVHSIYFEIMGEHGFVAFGLFLILIFCALLTAMKLKRTARINKQINWAESYASMFQISLIAYMVGGIFLGRAYFDLFYNIVAMVVITKILIEKELNTEKSVKPLSVK